MLILSWQLTLVAVILLPVLVIAQRRVGQVRARIATKTQESLSDMTAITQESLSVSGILLAKSFTQQQAETDRYTAENENQIDLQVKQQMSGQWFFAMVNIFLSIIPAIVYLVSAWLILRDVPVTAGTVVAFTTVQARLMWPLMGLLRVALDLQTSRALFARIFEYLDLEPAITDRPTPRSVNTSQVGRGRLRRRGVPLPGLADASPPARFGTSASRFGRASSRPSSDRRAPARRRCRTSSRGCTTCRAVACSSPATTCATCSTTRSCATSAS